MKNKVLLIVDMQNDFINGVFSNANALSIVGSIAKYAGKWDGRIIFTRDTHDDDYLKTTEGQYLPIPHCKALTVGWEINDKIMNSAKRNVDAKVEIVNKSTFSAGVPLYVTIHKDGDPDEIYICGTRTDICVISNALELKTMFPKAKIIILKNLCSGTTNEKHNNAIEAMKNCYCEIQE